MDKRGSLVLQDHNFSRAGSPVDDSKKRQSMVDEGHLQAKDYHLSYHFAAEGGDLTTTMAPPVICLKRFFVEHRVAEVVRRHEGPSPKSLDSNENFKP